MEYIKLSDANIAYSKETNDELFVLDFDINDNVVGIEILNTHRFIEYVSSNLK